MAIGIVVHQDVLQPGVLFHHIGQIYSFHHPVGDCANSQDFRVAATYWLRQRIDNTRVEYPEDVLEVDKVVQSFISIRKN